MKCVFISDLHIKEAGDNASNLFLSFCRHEETLTSDKIFFLGDIFDLLIGNHEEYLEQYQFYFKEITILLDKNIEVFFVEGNHDFEFKSVAESYMKENSKSWENYKYLVTGEYINLNQEKYYFCHGYEVDYFNKHFKRWFKVYTSDLFRFFISRIFSHSLIQNLGKKASGNSKKRGRKSFDFNEMRRKYLLGAKALIKDKKVKGVIAGHTHVAAFETFDNGIQYFNCGYPIKDKFFVYFNGKSFDKIKIKSTLSSE